MSNESGEIRDFLRYAATLFDALAEGLVVCEPIRNADGRLVDYWIRDANPIFLRRSPEGPTAIGRALLSMRPATNPWWFERCEEALRGADVRFEFRDPQSGRWYDAHIMRLAEDRFAQLFMDISARKATEQRQAELFDELNHRVKNNLAVVASVLELHARDAPAEVRAHLEKAVGRVRTIADLHTVLYQQNSTDRIDLCLYLESLSAGLRSALCDDGRISLVVDCAPLFVSVGMAVSLGLIVNELVTNAVKHAFVGRSEGRVEVALSAQGPGLQLRVADNGAGLGDSVASPTLGLGLRIVRSLTANLGADLRVLEGPGFGVEITIPELPRASTP